MGNGVNLIIFLGGGCVKTTIFVYNITYLLSNRGILDDISTTNEYSLVGLSSLEVLSIVESSIWNICDYWFGKGNANDPIHNTLLAIEIIKFLNTSVIDIRDKSSLTYQVYILSDQLHLAVNYCDTI